MRRQPARTIDVKEAAHKLAPRDGRPLCALFTAYTGSHGARCFLFSSRERLIQLRVTDYVRPGKEPVSMIVDKTQLVGSLAILFGFLHYGDPLQDFLPDEQSLEDELRVKRVVTRKDRLLDVYRPIGEELQNGDSVRYVLTPINFGPGKKLGWKNFVAWKTLVFDMEAQRRIKQFNEEREEKDCRRSTEERSTETCWEPQHVSKGLVFRKCGVEFNVLVEEDCRC